MKRICTLLFILVMLFVVVGSAQSVGGQRALQPNGSQQVYDRFDGKWLDTAKWLPDTPTCYSSLECVREIQNGQLRLAVRNLGGTDSDSGLLWGGPILWFQNPDAITSIQADITVRSFSGTACLTNNELASGQAQIGGTFFNVGTGDPGDDVFAILYTYIDTSAPTTITVSAWYGWNGQSLWKAVAQYPIGTALTGIFKWNKSNHQFIAGVKVKGEPGPFTWAALPYSASDTTPPVYPDKRLVGVAFSPNCTSGKTNAQFEARFDNVSINR
ncbi:MAG TPA: hypothetical protein VMH04_20285 [Candidatus Solibacter sp.]|nr:hypothetical protein [Candidatus Solibacter sp.]